jgi:hypothetical protein
MRRARLEALGEPHWDAEMVMAQDLASGKGAWMERFENQL